MVVCLACGGIAIAALPKSKEGRHGVTVCREVAWDPGSLSLYVDETQLVGSRLGK